MESNKSSHDNINLGAQTNLSKHVKRRILIRIKLRKCRLGQVCPSCWYRTRRVITQDVSV